MSERLRASIAGLHRAAEAEVVRRLRARQPDPAASKRIAERSFHLAERVRAAPAASLSAESFLRQYGLSTPEGVALMCVAEALLRIPDAETADALLRDKLATGQWSNASAADWALMLTGALVRWHDEPSTLKNLISRLGEPIVRTAVKQAMRILAGQFVVGETIEQATARAAERPRYRFSYDMLGEAARTADDAARYFKLYSHAIQVARPPDSVSVKLSALHSRFEEAKRARVLGELTPKIRQLAELAAQRTVGMTIDAEESERLELTLEVLESVPSAGIAVQAYQKRALAVCEWLVELGRSSKRRIPVRLVKGAYWDGEVKRAQQLGMPDYPVFTRKAATDVSYVACATTLLSAPDAIYPAFATHNCRTVATILESGFHDFEFQKLYGMGDALYDILLADHPHVQCRVYAPVGSFTDLLPYLVRRLLENGANTSFVHQIADPKVPLAALVADPMHEPLEPDSRIPLPRDLYPDRRNSLGMDLSLRTNLDALKAHVAADGALPPAESTSEEELDFSLARATEAFESWSRTPASERAAILERAADLLEQRMVELVSLIVREGRRTFADAVSEVREAADFCRYYAVQAKLHFSPKTLAGPAGERNELRLHGRGVFACISPWNFPLAIFTGQVAAALAAGNAVIAKPAEQTPRTGMRALEIMYEAGVPADVACCAIGDGGLGARLVADPRIAGVAFTGSVETARLINKSLSDRKGPIVPLIAETGGVNAMIVDSSALPEQVVDDTVASAFQSAGQRCSAQRILFVEAGAAPRTLELLRGALAELKVGDPGEPDTDVGPVIDKAAHDALAHHIRHLRQSAKLVGAAHLSPDLHGNYIAPIAFALKLEDLPRTEVFGPVLHVCIYRHEDLERVLAWLRDTGYGLTLGIHSRIQSFIDQVVAATRVGNTYVNRNMIGAVVGVQPFGGEGLSGTGPKAGGPHYLPRFAIERTLTVNTAAIGGVTELLSRPERPRP